MTIRSSLRRGEKARHAFGAITEQLAAASP
jgi:hypothetical protein